MGEDKQEEVKWGGGGEKRTKNEYKKVIIIISRVLFTKHF